MKPSKISRETVAAKLRNAELDKAIWEEVCKVGWSLRDETVEEVVARIVEMTGWTQDHATQMLSDDLQSRGESLPLARQVYAERASARASPGSLASR